MDATNLFMHAVVLMLVLMNTFIVKSETLQTDMYEVAYDMSESILRVCRKKRKKKEKAYQVQDMEMLHSTFRL